MARNKITDDFYIGITSRTIQYRRHNHEYSAKKGKNVSILCKAIRKYGVDNFIWTKIGGCENYKDCLELESYLIKEMRPKYNICAGGEKNNLGFNHSQETKNKISKAHKGKKISQVSIEKMSLSLKKLYETKPGTWTGRKHSEESKKKMSESTKGQPGYWKGKKLLPHVVESITERGKKNVDKWLKFSHLGPKAISKKIICIEDGNTFNSIREAGKFYDLDESSISEHCRSRKRRKTVGGRTFKYLEEQ